MGLRKDIITSVLPGFPKTRGTLAGLLIKRIMVLTSGVYIGVPLPPIYGNIQYRLLRLLKSSMCLKSVLFLAILELYRILWGFNGLERCLLKNVTRASCRHVAKFPCNPRSKTECQIRGREGEDTLLEFLEVIPTKSLRGTPCSADVSLGSYRASCFEKPPQ